MRKYTNLSFIAILACLMCVIVGGLYAYKGEFSGATANYVLAIVLFLLAESGAASK